jgi:cytochrome c-type biogenesis protein CcmH
MRWAIVIWLCFAGAAFAQTSPEEQRARDIGAQLRCVVCQNQSIEESDAQLAQDMRIVVREQLATGASNEDVIEHIRDAYGDYVLLKPPVQSNTYALWFLPAILVLLSLGWFAFRRKHAGPADTIDPLSDSDESLLKTLMDNDG